MKSTPFRFGSFGFGNTHPTVVPMLAALLKRPEVTGPSRGDQAGEAWPRAEAQRGTELRGTTCKRCVVLALSRGCGGGPRGPLSVAVVVLQGMPPLSPEKPALCAGCGGKISDRYYLLAVDKQWHLRCLKCCECKLALESELTCFAKDGSIYCKEDYYRYPAARDPRAAACPSPARSPTFLPIGVRLAVPRPGTPTAHSFEPQPPSPLHPQTRYEGW